MIFLVLFISDVFAWNVNFDHFPATNITHNIKTHNWYNVLSYRWDAISAKKNINLNELRPLIQQRWYFWFMKYSYYWRYELLDTKDKNINLSRLWRKKLNYPMVGITQGDKFLLFIPSWNLSDSQIETIWQNYESENKKFKIRKYPSNWYILSQTAPRNPIRTFEYQEYFDTLKDLSWLHLVNFQVWQNPYWEYDIANFSDKFIQVEIIQNWQLRGIILDLLRTTQRVIVEEPQQPDYYRHDKHIMEEMKSLYYNIREYKKSKHWLPQDLWSLYPNFLDITRINRYYHTLMSQKTSNLCFKVWFQPKSIDFNQKYSSEIQDWYWTTEFCYY